MDNPGRRVMLDELRAAARNATPGTAKVIKRAIYDVKHRASDRRLPEWGLRPGSIFNQETYCTGYD